MSISTLSCVCAFENLARFQAREYLFPSGKTKGLRIEFSRSSKVAPFRDTHPETRVVRILEDQRFASFARKPRSLLELPIHQRGWRNRVIPGNRPITFSSPRGDVPRVITQRLLRPCVHFHPSSSSSPLYISLYPPSLPSLFLLPLRPLRVPYERTGAAKHCRRGRRKEGNHLPLLLLLPLIPREE